MKTKTIAASLLIMMLGLQNVKAQIQSQTAQTQKTQTQSFSNDGEMRCVKKGDFNISFKVGYLTIFDLDNTYSSGGTPISLELGYAVSDHVIIGVEAGYFKTQTTTTNIPATVIQQSPYYYSPDTVSYPYSYHYTNSIIYYMADLQWHWLNKQYISLYSGLALGGTSVSSALVVESGDATAPLQPSISGVSYQLTAFGFKAMGKHFGAHFEFGYGIMGITSGGFDLRF